MAWSGLDKSNENKIVYRTVLPESRQCQWRTVIFIPSVLGDFGNTGHVCLLCEYLVLRSPVTLTVPYSDRFQFNHIHLVCLVATRFQPPPRKGPCLSGIITDHRSEPMKQGPCVMTIQLTENTHDRGSESKSAC